MAIDASIAAGQAPNMLQTLLGATQLKGAQLQQQQLSQQMGANKATSAAYQQAYDPATGRVDNNKLFSLLAQDPNAAYNLPTVQGQVLEQQNKQLEYDKNKFDLGMKQNNYFKNQFGALLKNPEITGADLARIGAGLVKDGLVPVEEVIRGMQNIPDTPEGRKQWVSERYQQSLDADSQLKLLLPQTQVLNTGGQQQIIAIDPMTGQPRVTGAVQNTMDPNTASAPVAAFDPNTGAPINITRQQFQDQAGGMAQPQMGLPGTGMNGRYPGTTAPAGVQTGPSLGQAAAAETVGKGSADAVLNLQNQAEGSPQRVYFLQDMLTNLPKFDSGPTADWTAKANALALQLAPGMSARLGIDPQSVASKEEFAKFATNLAINSSSGLGAGTDSKLAAAVAGNPNASLSKLGNEQIMKVLIGTERATQAKNEAWQNSGEQPQNYGKWAAQWNKDVDPRVFVAPELTQEERAKMFKGLSEKDKATFSRSYNNAVRSGIIQRPGS